MSLKFGSVSSGIEAASVAWEPLGWKAQFFSEIAPFPSKVLKYRFPDVPNLGDMLLLTKNQQFNDATIDLLVGGTPCQSFSLAGLRAGLNSANGNLALEYCRLLKAKRPRWFVWENVPGVFSSFSNETGGPDNNSSRPGDSRDITETADFAALLSAFRECGYCCAWRVLDAQFFGVPQRRRRVFVIGYLGNDWRPPFSVLFDSEIGKWNINQVRKKGSKVAALTSNGIGASGPDDNQEQAGHLIPFNYYFEKNITGTLSDRHDFAITDYCLSNFLQPILLTMREGSGGGGKGPLLSVNQSLTLATGNNQTLFDKTGVRKLTPLECERLQGFPDNWTKIPGAKDSPRYKSLGNSMAVPVMYWIGRRIQLVEDVLNGKI